MQTHQPHKPHHTTPIIQVMQQTHPNSTTPSMLDVSLAQLMHFVPGKADSNGRSRPPAASSHPSHQRGVGISGAQGHCKTKVSNFGCQAMRTPQRIHRSPSHAFAVVAAGQHHITSLDDTKRTTLTQPLSQETQGQWSLHSPIIAGTCMAAKHSFASHHSTCKGQWELRCHCELALSSVVQAHLEVTMHDALTVQVQDGRSNIMGQGQHRAGLQKPAWLRQKPTVQSITQRALQTRKYQGLLDLPVVTLPGLMTAARHQHPASADVSTSWHYRLYDSTSNAHNIAFPPGRSTP